MRKKKHKPMSPEQIAAKRLAERMEDFAVVNLPGSAAALATFDDVVVDRAVRQSASKRGNVDRARRTDVFDALKDGMTAGSYDAARRLERDMALRAGENGRGPNLDRVDCDGQRDRTDAMLLAGQRIDGVLALLGDREGWLLTELILPVVTRPTWRQTVAHITGESHAHAQAAVVRSACENLRDAYQRYDRKAP